MQCQMLWVKWALLTADFIVMASISIDVIAILGAGHIEKVKGYLMIQLHNDHQPLWDLCD